MAEGSDDPRVYVALMIPPEALEKGGVEILRAGLVEDMLNVHAVPAFDDPTHWGDVLAEIAEALADLYPEQPGALEAITARFLIECGREIEPAPAPKAARKAAPKSKSATKPTATKPKTTKSKATKPKATKPKAAKPTAAKSKASKSAPRPARAAPTTTRTTKRKR